MLTQQFNNLSQNEKVLYLQAIINIAATDGEISEPEREFINLQAKFLGIDVKNYLKHPDSFKIEELKKEKISKFTAKLIIKDCIFLGYLDGIYSEEEKRKIREIAKTMGLKEIDVILAEIFMENYLKSIEYQGLFLTNEQNIVVFKVEGEPPKKDSSISLWTSQLSRVSSLVEAAKKAMINKEPFSENIIVIVKIYSTQKQSDLDNQLAGILDVLRGWEASFQTNKERNDLPEDLKEKAQKPIVYKDDSQIVEIIASKEKSDKNYYIVCVIPIK